MNWFNKNHNHNYKILDKKYNVYNEIKYNKIINSAILQSYIKDLNNFRNIKKYFQEEPNKKTNQYLEFISDKSKNISSTIDFTKNNNVEENLGTIISFFLGTLFNTNNYLLDNNSILKYNSFKQIGCLYSENYLERKLKEIDLFINENQKIISDIYFWDHILKENNIRYLKHFIASVKQTKKQNTNDLDKNLLEYSFQKDNKKLCLRNLFFEELAKHGEEELLWITLSYPISASDFYKYINSDYYTYAQYEPSSTTKWLMNKFMNDNAHLKLKPGLNLKGKCVNKNCIFYNKKVWSCNGFDYGFDNFRERCNSFNIGLCIKYTTCINCNNFLIDIDTIGVYECGYSFRGIFKSGRTFICEGISKNLSFKINLNNSNLDPHYSFTSLNVKVISS